MHSCLLYTVMISYLQNGNSVVKVVVFHGGSGINGRKGRGVIGQKLVRIPSMVNVMAQARHQQSQHLLPSLGTS